MTRDGQAVSLAGTIAERDRLAAELADAMQAADNYRNGMAAIADAVLARGVPFVFVTGYGQQSLPRSFSTAPMLAKPFNSEQLLEAVLPLVR